MVDWASEERLANAAIKQTKQRAANKCAHHNLAGNFHL